MLKTYKKSGRLVFFVFEIIILLGQGKKRGFWTKKKIQKSPTGQFVAESERYT